MEEAIQISRQKKDKFLNRIAIIDLIRGFFMCLVIFDHIMWNFQYFFPMWASALGMAQGDFLYDLGQLARKYWVWDLRNVVRFLSLNAFVLLSGISVVFSKNNDKRAIKMVILWFLISIVTNIVNGFWPAGCLINFNIIAVIAMCVLLYCVTSGGGYKSIAATLLLLFAFQFALVPTLDMHLRDKAAFLPMLWWPNNVTINGMSYQQADYMPLFPFIIAFFLGALFSIFYYKPRVKNHQLGNHYNWERPFCFMGRNSLIIYLTHQIIFQFIFISIGVGLGLPVGN